MNRLYTLAILFVLSFTANNAQIIISEIMYNPPEGGQDTLEYIELYNAGPDAVNLENYTFTQGVEYTFPSYMLNASEFVVVAGNSDAVGFLFDINALQWDEGALSNGGEDIILADANGTEVDIVDYGPESPWPTFADGTNGGGASIEFCLNADDNALGENWSASTNEVGDTINAVPLRGTPGATNTATCGSSSNTTTVILSGITFTPADITINIGETVLWKNEDGFHNVNGSLETYPNNPEGFFSGGAASAPWEWSYTFTEEGVYDYQCDPHESVGMVGTVTVVNNIPDLIITEIMYNDPSADDQDSLEFVEVYNAGSAAVELEGIVFSSNVINYTLPSGTLEAGEFLLIYKQMNQLVSGSGALSVQWEVGGLSNNSDVITLETSDGDIIDQVAYEDSVPWPTEADGQGYSLSLCSIVLDNSDATSWQITSSPTDIEFDDGLVVFANPGAFNVCDWDIASASSLDTNGVPLYDGTQVSLQGTVYGVNLRAGGLQFTIIDGANEGIGVFSASESFGYEVAEGDEIMAIGNIGHFNGLTQIYVDTVMMLSSGNTLIEPRVITELTENDESSLISIENVSLVDPSQWTSSGSGFNVDVSDGNNIFDVRIDGDVVDVFTAAYPTGTFTLTGIGGQFDSSEPHTEGYQILPRYLADISPYVPFEEEYPMMSIGEVTQNNEDGSAASDGEKVQITGVTHGINLRPSGLQFTIIDENNDGIGLFLGSGDLGYSYNEGDMINIRGTISQFNGLTQINPDSITFMSSGNDLAPVIETQTLGEETESQLIRLAGLKVVDPTQWAGDGSSFNVDVENADGVVMVLRIDSDVDLSSMTLPGDMISVTGLGGQFDNSAPYDEGYQVLPRYASDIEASVNTEETILNADLIKIYPNPIQDILRLESSLNIEQAEIYDLLGSRVLLTKDAKKVFQLSDLTPGNYFLKAITSDGIVVKEFVKQ